MLNHEPEENDNDTAAGSGRVSASGESAEAAAPKRTRRRAASRPAGTPDSNITAAVAEASAELAQSGAALGTPESEDSGQAPAKKAAAKRATRKRTTTKKAVAAEAAPDAAPAAEQAEPRQAPQGAESGQDAAAEQAEAAPATTRRTRKRAASRSAGAPTDEAAEAAPATTTSKRSAAKRTASAGAASDAAAEAVPVAASAESGEARASAPAAETTDEAAEATPTKPVANAKRTRKAGTAKRAAKRAASAPEGAPEPEQPETIAVVALPEELDEDAAVELVEALAKAGSEPEDHREAGSPFAPGATAGTPAWSGSLFQAPVVSVTPFKAAAPAAAAAAAAPAPAEESKAADEDDDEDESTAGGRRRRRSRNRRGASSAAGSAGAESAAEESKDEEPSDESKQDESDSAQHPETLGLPEETSRRRRRRRRRQTAEDLAAGSGEGTDDPPNTVTKVREPRQRRSSGGPDTVTTGDDVMGLRGSVRLVAKQQRRREGRATRSRRAPIVSEAEFLARREAVERVMVVRQSAGRTQIGVLEDGVLVEHYVNRESSVSYVGNVYQGKVQNVLPSMEAAFVDINKGRNAVLYAGEVNFDAAGLNGQPRRIESALKSGQSVLVQVTKDPIGHKGARLTSQISLPGRFLVYIPGGSMMGISRKLPDTERARLKQILKKVLPEDGGVIVRTAAEGASEQELSQDVARLVAQWEEIERKAKTATAPALLSGEPDLTVRVVRDIFNEDFSKLIVSGDTAYKTVHEYLNGVAPELAERVEHWTSETDVFSTYRIEEQLAKALDRKVWLPSGGSLVIDRTEAMVVIDVNTGKFTGQGSSSLEETVTRNNLEAAEEIVRQLRLRDLGGIVVIDFIDMVLESNRDLVLRRLLECLGRDRTKHQVAEVTSLGLVQMTRKRVGQGLLEAFSEPCDHCNGRGVIVHTDPVEHPGKRAEQQGSGKGGKRDGGNGAGGNGNGNGGSRGGQAQEQEHAEDHGAESASGERGEDGPEGRRSRRRRKAGRAATHEQGTHDEHEQHEAEHGEGRGEGQGESHGHAQDEQRPEQRTEKRSEERAAEQSDGDAGGASSTAGESPKGAGSGSGKRSARKKASAPATEPAGDAVPAQAAPQESAEPAVPLSLKAHADDPDSLEGALADSGRPRRRARRAASRPAGAPSA